MLVYATSNKMTNGFKQLKKISSGLTFQVLFNGFLLNFIGTQW
jgi:hypothetical protein